MAEQHIQSTTNGHKSDIFERLRKTGATSSPDRLEECFRIFDADKDGALNREEFGALLEAVFCNDRVPYDISARDREEFFRLLDEDNDGKLDMEEFKICWYHWLKQVLDPKTAFIIVDVQNDFISGSLAVTEGEQVVPIINKLIHPESQFDYVVYSLDWHPENHISFFSNVHERPLDPSSKHSDPDTVNRFDTVVFTGPPTKEQTLWPDHCVQHTWGAELHPELKQIDDLIIIHKGINPEIDSYSAFWDNKKASQTNLVKVLSERQITDVYICGIAYDICVAHTTLHAIEHGFRTILVDDACRGIDAGDIKSMQDKIVSMGGIIINSERIPKMCKAVDRRPELGLQAARNVSMARRLVRQGISDKVKNGTQAQ